MSPSSPFSSRAPLLLIGALVAVALVGYSLFVATPYLLGPRLTVIEPTDGSSVSGVTVPIVGTTDRVSYLLIDDLPVPILEDGTFRVERAYPPGYTVLVVRARDRFGREVLETIHFLHTSNTTIHGTEEEVGGKAEPQGN